MKRNPNRKDAEQPREAKILLGTGKTKAVIGTVGGCDGKGKRFLVCRESQQGKVRIVRLIIRLWTRRGRVSVGVNPKTGGILWHPNGQVKRRMVT